MGVAIYRLGEDAYCKWSSVVDAPVSPIWSRAEVLEAGVEPAVLDRADRLGHSWADTDRPKTPQELVAYNRAGPQESCLTLDAILRRYGPGAETFELRPEDIRPLTTTDGGTLYWVPWPPDEAPAAMTPETDLHARVPLQS